MSITQSNSLDDVGETEDSEDGNRSSPALPIPFWEKKSSLDRQDRPEIPNYFEKVVKQLEAEDRDVASRWNAAHWHLSQAYFCWNEDPHSAAAMVWQALESFSPNVKGGSYEKVKIKSKEIFDFLPEKELRHLAIRIQEQSSKFKDQQVESNWWWWLQTSHVELEAWIDDVCRETSYRYSGKWITPYQPIFLSHDRSGLLNVMYRKKQYEEKDKKQYEDYKKQYEDYKKQYEDYKKQFTKSIKKYEKDKKKYAEKRWSGETKVRNEEKQWRRNEEQQIRTEEQQIRTEEQQIRTEEQQIRTEEQQIRTEEQQIRDKARPEIWMDQRLESDLALLYALRNRVVHSGSYEVLSQNMAQYLGRLGAQIILELMADKAKKSPIQKPSSQP